jgi:hypothetical protein
MSQNIQRTMLVGTLPVMPYMAPMPSLGGGPSAAARTLVRKSAISEEMTPLRV